MNFTPLAQTIAILGLDGATWDVIDPLLAQGRLPHLARLMERGAYGRIATLPGYTSPALWTTILTGKLPDKHGVRDFYTATGRHLRVKPIYEMLDQEPMGLFQMYATRWQPERVGFMAPSRIEGSHAAQPGDLGFVVNFNAGNLLTQSGQLLRHGVPPWALARAGLMALSKSVGLQDTEQWQHQADVLGQQFRGYIAAHLIKQYRPAFFASLFYLLDQVGHYYWRYWKPSYWADFQRPQVRRKGRTLPAAYEEVDRQIGRMLKALPPSSLIAVVSDHGMETASSQGGGKPLTVRGGRVLAALNLSEEFTTELVPPFESVFRAKLPRWTPDATARLIHQVGEATLADGTHPFLVSSSDRQMVTVRLSPSLLTHLGEDVALPAGAPAPLARFIFEHQEINGTHAPYGILILSGNGVEQGVRLDDCALADVTPTLLALSGRPIARDMDGRVVERAMEGAFLARHPVQFIDTYEDAAPVPDPAPLDDVELEVIQSRLRDMGYLA